ncbi:MAG: DUF1801 domain-containing protein [Clostridiaceae bacterium]
MISKALTPLEYIAELPPERQSVMTRLREVVSTNLPDDFVEMMQYGMISWVVPLSVYPAGYHCTPGEPLSFIGIAAQKNFYGVYHMGLYGEEGNELMDWFKTEYEKRYSRRLDAGKSCLRFKNPDYLPYDLIGELATKITAHQFAEAYSAFDPRNNHDRK